MRFISKYRRYKISVREHVKMTLANGKDNVIQQGITCEFQHGGVYDTEKEIARRTFKIKGATQEEDEVTPVDPFTGPGSRLSTFDTEAPHHLKEWAQIERLEGLKAGQIRQEVEQFLLDYPARGQDYIVVIPEKIQAPWPKYDSLVVHGQRKIHHVVEKIVVAIGDLGVDPDHVVAYEQQNLNRPEVVDAVLALNTAEEEEAEPLVAA